jgi:hypothetical protein
MNRNIECLRETPHGYRQNFLPVSNTSNNVNVRKVCWGLAAMIIIAPAILHGTLYMQEENTMHNFQIHHTSHTVIILKVPIKER